MSEKTIIEENWEILKRFLPEEWEDKAVQVGALSRKRKVSSPEALLRILLVHLATGLSLRATAAYAKQAKICNINDVSLLHRLKASGEWFRWMSLEIVKELKGPKLPINLFSKYQIKLVDGTTICEPGSTGSDWKMHYCFMLDDLKCSTFKITSPKVGESLQLYPVMENDLFIADRLYCQRKGIMHVLKSKGQVLIRFHSTHLPLYTRRGKKWPVLDNLRSLNNGEIGDWDVWFENPDRKELVKGRLCAIRKGQEACERSKKQIKYDASRKGKRIQPETLEYAEYVVLFTTVSRRNFNSKELLNLYRGRWQIELVFKRLKSIVGIGHLPKYNQESCIAWLYGKMLIALLTERLYQEVEFFSPWGYPLQ